MSGHSKWNNIKRRKGAADAVKGKLFTKLGREIQMAVKSGGPDPDVNSSLKDAIAKAKSNNMPSDSIKRSIEKASKSGEGEDYEEIIYEGHGPEGVAIILRALTDNRNRTAGEVRHLFDKYGGSLGKTGSASFMFEVKGYFALDKEEFSDEDSVMMDALDAGAEDVKIDDEAYEIICAPDAYHEVLEHLEKLGYKFLDMKRGPIPINYTEIDSEENQEKVEKLLDALEDNDDVQDVYHNMA